MMFDELSATQQIHQEEQALEIKETIFARIQWTLLSNCKTTPHTPYDDDWGWPFPSSGVLLPASLFYLMGAFLVFSNIRDFPQ